MKFLQGAQIGDQRIASLAKGILWAVAIGDATKILWEFNEITATFLLCQGAYLKARQCLQFSRHGFRQHRPQ